MKYITPFLICLAATIQAQELQVTTGELETAITYFVPEYFDIKTKLNPIDKQILNNLLVPFTYQSGAFPRTDLEFRLKKAYSHYHSKNEPLPRFLQRAGKLQKLSNPEIIIVVRFSEWAINNESSHAKIKQP